jgi:tRNA threonylcarbamoyl adenosine modification protein (Sua5/YciO/YrdC/YwlC family)
VSLRRKSASASAQHAHDSIFSNATDKAATARRRDAGMGDRIEIHPVNPQARLLQRAVDALQQGALLVAPSDAGYLFAWAVDAVRAEERVQKLRGLDSKHPFTLLCARLSDVGRMAKLDDRAFRIVKPLVPGPYTFILPVSSELPRRFKQAKRKVIGCRVPEHPVLQSLLEAWGSPLLSTSLELSADASEASPDRQDAFEVAEQTLRHVDLMLDSGDCPPGPTSVIDLTGDTPLVVREGVGPIDL